MAKSTPTPKNRITCGIREAKTRFSQLLDEVNRGAEVFITDRGKPVGKLVALEISDLSLEDRLARLTLAGRLQPAKEPYSLPPPLHVRADVQAMLQADREG